MDWAIENTVQHVKRLREMSPLWELVQEGVDLKTIQVRSLPFYHWHQLPRAAPGLELRCLWPMPALCEVCDPVIGGVLRRQAV